MNDNITVVSSPVLENEEQELLGYWTKEAMENAIPIEARLEEQQFAEIKSVEPWKQEGQPMVMENFHPIETDLTREPLAERFDELAGFNTRKVNSRNIIPYSAVGKMYMTFGGINYVGTGWVIADKAVFTAGHCVFDSNNKVWADNILFVPQYNSGTSPLGSWSALQIHSLKGWTENELYEYDMATFVVNSAIRPKTGSLGWMANYPPNQGQYNSIGYPARIISGYNFDGQNMWQSIGNYIKGKNPIQMSNNMTQGCSGGPWIVNSNGKPYVNGLNSFRYGSEPETMYSPYFGDGFINLYNTVKNA